MQSGPPQSNRRHSQGRSFHAVVVVLLIAGQFFAAAESIELAWSDHLYSGTEKGDAERAVALKPDNAEYRTWLAELQERSGEDPLPMLRQALALKPDDSGILIRLGLLEEAAGDIQQAEGLLLEAARISRKYQPRWTLANFYFRRGDSEPFWRWAREAFAVSYGDRTPLFRLCWNVAPDSSKILREAIPETRAVRLAWLRFLAGRGQLPDAATLAAELAAGASEQEANQLIRIADVLLHDGHFGEALSVWNRLCLRELIPSKTINPDTSDVVTNGDFARPTMARGFDWRIPQLEGVFVTQSPRCWRIALTGGQPERREIVTQAVPLSPAGLYRFYCRYRSRPAGTASEAARSGLRWRLRIPGVGVLAESEELVLAGDEEMSFEFRVPEDVSGAVLSLYHERSSGSMRMEGSVELEEVRLGRF